MNKKIVCVLYLAAFFLHAAGISGQTLKPAIQFMDNAATHNVHIAFDGDCYYTVNGGVAEKGRINKYSAEGEFLKSYKMNLDMRSIMYNAKEKKFYVCTYDGIIFRVADLERGKCDTVFKGLYDFVQASLAMSPNGKYLYYFHNGTLNIFKFPGGELYKTLTGFDRGSTASTGSSAVAVDGKHIYTWNAEYKLIFVYDMKGTKLRSVQISNGDYGFSLSCANGFVFVSKDGDYNIGSWFGYDLQKK